MDIEKRKQNFINKSIKAHNNKYDYSKVNYQTAKIPVTIICPDHGEFLQRPENHYRGIECPSCKGGIKLDKKHFIKKAKKRHKNKYDYSKVEYQNNHTPVTIICPKHGKFQQNPADHYKYDCNQCGEDKAARKKTLTQKQFISKCIKIHGDLFDYSKISYKGHRNKVVIICKEHGDFKQKANSHLRGAGCPVCKESRGERKIRKFLEENNIKYKTEMTFKECRNIQPLRFDFYLPQQNICIEYDGIGHFKEGEGVWFTKESIKEGGKRDKIKDTFCNKKGNPSLIRISYKEDVEEKLNSILLTLL